LGFASIEEPKAGADETDCEDDPQLTELVFFFFFAAKSQAKPTTEVVSERPSWR
jgi:hypothetical protein